MKLRKAAVPAMAVLAAGLGFMSVAATAGDSRQEKILAEFENKTGLKPVQIPDTGGAYLGKTHRGYTVLDHDAVSFLWAGSETDYSGMIVDHGGYYKMINSILDDLADIADAIPVRP